MTDEEIKIEMAFHPEIEAIAKKVAHRLIEEHKTEEGHANGVGLFVQVLATVMMSIGVMLLLLHWFGMP